MDNFCSQTIKAIEMEHPNSGQRISYTFNAGILCIYPNFIQQLQFSFKIVGAETLKIINTSEDPNNPGFSLDIPVINNGNNPSVMFKTIWGRENLFLDTSFRTADYNYVCEVGEDYHTLAKKYPMTDNQFDILFCEDRKKLITPEIEQFVIELTFKE
jgi:hypothetical protein